MTTLRNQTAACITRLSFVTPPHLVLLLQHLDVNTCTNSKRGGGTKESQIDLVGRSTLLNPRASGNGGIGKKSAKTFLSSRCKQAEAPLRVGVLMRTPQDPQGGLGPIFFLFSVSYSDTKDTLCTKISSQFVRGDL